MGIPIEKDLMDTILKLTREEKIELILTVSRSIIPLGSYGGATPAADLTESQRLEVLERLEGAWKDSTPDDLAAQIIEARTYGREVDLDD